MLVLLVPASAEAGGRLSAGTVRAEALEIGREATSDRSSGISGYYVSGCKRRSRRRVICRLMLTSGGDWGPPTACELPVMGVLKRGKVRFYVGADCVV